MWQSTLYSTLTSWGHLCNDPQPHHGDPETSFFFHSKLYYGQNHLWVGLFPKISTYIPLNETAIRAKPVRESTKTQVKEEGIEPNFSDELEGDDAEGEEEEETKLTLSLFFFELNITAICLT